MTQFGSFDTLEGDEPFEGVHRRAFSTDRATVTEYRFAPGAQFPQHHHHQAQITLVEEGDVTFTVDGDARDLGPGEWSVVPGHVPHGLRAGPCGARIRAILVPARGSTEDVEFAADA